MGNSGSQSNNEIDDDPITEPSLEKLEKDSVEDDGILDLNVLFDLKQLRTVSDKIKEDTNVNTLQKHYTSLIRWLEERRSRGMETVTLIQFVDSFVNKGASKEVATEIFRQFDVEENGVVDLDYLHEMLDLSNRSFSGFMSVKDDMRTVNKLLQDCPLSPGFIDAFTDNKTEQLNHSERLYKYLSHNRASSQSLPLPALKCFITKTDMRMKVLTAHLKALKEKADSRKQEPTLQADEVLKPIARCFTSVEVSTNKNNAFKLMDNDNATYWQSDGPARSHWIRLKIPPNVVIKHLSMYVASSDQSYMPNHVVIYGGNSDSTLRELNDVQIPNHITGDFTLLENFKVPYHIIQIAIKRCHSDGCDTRVRQIKAIGYRVIKSKGVSVMDATAMWYLSVLASTAQAALPIAPHLRESIISHTRSSLYHMGPLSLSASSIERPGFLSNSVMEQMEKFLHTIICCNDSVEPDELLILLQFSVARGNLGSILEVLKLIFEKITLEYRAFLLLQSLSETKEHAIIKHGQKLPVVVLCCDGGAKDKGPSVVLQENTKSGDTYFTSNGKTKCNFTFGLKSGNLIQLTRVSMKFSKGAWCPKAGLIFVFDADNIKDENGETFYQSLEKYDTCSEEEYKKYKERGFNDDEVSPYDPVAFFNIDKEWIDWDVPVDKIKTGSCVTIKFLGPRQDTAECLGIISICLYGYEQSERSSQQIIKLNSQFSSLSEEDDAAVPGVIVFLQVLNFLHIMSKDAVYVKQKAKDSTEVKDCIIDANDVTMEQIWNLYKQVNQSSLYPEELLLAQELLLLLFHIVLPYLKPGAQRQNKEKNKSKRTQLEKFEKGPNEYEADVFQSLCDIVDNGSSSLATFAKAVILDGAEVFFPDAQTRRLHLLSLVDKVLEDGKATSLACTFESLCKFFSNKDASGLLGLPDHLPKESFQPESVIQVMKTLISVACRESISAMEGGGENDSPSNLVSLLCALQKSFLAWCHLQCGCNISKNIVMDILLEYVGMICNSCNKVFELMCTSKYIVNVIDKLEQSFVSIAMRQLILFLNLFLTMEINYVALLNKLQPLAYTLQRMSDLFPEFFLQDDTCTSENSTKHIVLREWECESNHDYMNNSSVSKVFNCPGCSSFKVEFDPLCETERRYDYLEFTDSLGSKTRFDQKVGSETWPNVVTFDAGQKLHFLFHSDGSKVFWGYKFKVYAIGNPDLAISWIFDLQLTLWKFFGSFCGSALDSRKALGSLNSSEENDNNEEQALLHSKLWASLFRGGYLIGKLERSLSGFHQNNPSDCEVSTFLSFIATTKTPQAEEFISRCKLLSNPLNLGGGEIVDSTINAVFAALIWHTQELREKVCSVLLNPCADIPTCFVTAYTSAESIRRSLLLKRQNYVIQEEQLTNNGGQPVDLDTPVISCREKALFLLKFAGLSKLASKKQLNQHSTDRRPILNRSSKSFVKQDSIESKRSNSLYHDDFHEKFPSFQMVLDFVTNDTVSHTKIQELLKHRSKYATTIADVYLFASDLLSCSEKKIQFPTILFLQNLLMFQDHLPLHYSNFLNGCGLEKESRVRKNFYSLIRRLVDIIFSAMKKPQKMSSTNFKYMLIYLLHLLGIEWKPYDFEFIMSIKLPHLLALTLTGTSPPKTIYYDEKAELAMYERHKKFKAEADGMGIKKWNEMVLSTATPEAQLDMHLFIARYSSVLEVVVNCDGCDKEIHGRRYRCLVCTDLDLCADCYSNNVKVQDHFDQHEIVDLMFTCNSCNAFIIETRIHCNDCKDFDLCLGCYRSEVYPKGHTSSHKVTISRLTPGGLFPTKGLTTVLLAAYIHHQSWIQLSSLAISLSECLQKRKWEGVEAVYINDAISLFFTCLQKLVGCIKSPPGFAKSESFGVSESEEIVMSVTTNSFTQNSDKNTIHAFSSSQSSNIPLTMLSEKSENNEVEYKITSSESYFSIHKSVIDEPPPPLEEDEEDILNKSKGSESMEESLSSQFSPIISIDNLGSAEPLHERPVHDISRLFMKSATDIKSEDTSSEQSINSILELPKDNEIVDITHLFLRPEDDVQSKDFSASVSNVSEDIKNNENSKPGVFEKVLCLIGAVLPINKNYGDSYFVHFSSFVSTKLIPILFDIIENQSFGIKLRTITLGVLTKTLKCFQPEVIDAGLAKARSLEITSLAGEITISQLFQTGAQCLKNADLDAASGVESVLRNLLPIHAWNSAVTKQANSILSELGKNSEKPSLIALFTLMFVAGFPDTFRIGSFAILKEPGSDVKHVCIVEYQVERMMVSTVNFKTRKTVMAKESVIEIQTGTSHILDSERLTSLLVYVKESLPNYGALLAVESKWALGLVCKSVLNSLNAGLNEETIMLIIDSGIVPCIVNLACQGTGFNKQWLLRDLEVLTWKLYKFNEVSDKNAENASNVEKLDVVDSAKPQPSPLDDLDEDTKLCLKSMHEALNYSYPILRAIYDFHNQDREKLLEEVQRSFDDSGNPSISAEILELSRKWEHNPEPVKNKNVVIDSALDFGILKFQPEKVELKGMQAKPESFDNPNKLIATLTEEEINATRYKQRRFKSSELLKEELNNKQRANHIEFFKQLTHAVSVGYARHLVGWLFAVWPKSIDIYPMLGDIDPHQIVGLLDLIQSNESKEHFQKVVFNFIQCCSKPLALPAVQCMGEVQLPSITVESEHKYKNNAKIEDKVCIPGASSLFVRFDERCSTEYNCDELILSTSPNLQQNRRVFSGSGDWQDFEMPGDTIYYQFTSDSSNNDWGWKFVVTGGQLGRFETGCTILSALLSQDHHVARKLPLKHLWTWLIVVACNQVGQQRLMATGLLLRILQICAGDEYLFGPDIEPTLPKNRPDLSLLRPLWTLYTNSIEGDSGTSLTLISPVIRGLSELFLVVENVAQDWGEADCLVAGLASDEKLTKCFSKAVRVIAAIGLAIDLPNKAFDMIQNARNVPPPSTTGLINDHQEISFNKRSTISLRITGSDASSDPEDCLLTDYSDEGDVVDNDDNDDDEDSDDGDDMSSDLSEPEPPPL
nr:zinc finger ZZ-type and EF-hand domain-containing protein 1 [Hydra vulgaris]